jgi:phage shock protein A
MEGNMTESVIKRVKRLVSGKIEDSIDTMERAGGTSVMREAIRETERAIEDVKSERDEATLKRLQAIRQQKLYTDRLESLTEKAQFALDEGREDLARAALSRQVEYEAQIENIQKAESRAVEEEREWEENLAQLEMRRARMQEELEAFEVVQAEMGIDSDTNRHTKRDSERKIDRAEAAFNRAMSGAGGVAGVDRLDIKTTQSLAELDTMRRDQIITDRLAALRQKKAS